MDIYLFCYYKGLRCPAFYSFEDIVQIVHNTEEIISTLFKQGYTKQQQIELFRCNLDYYDSLLIACKELKENDADYFTYIDNLNYWTAVLALLRFKDLKEDKYNGMAKYEPEEKHKEILKSKLKQKINKKRNKHCDIYIRQ